MTFPSRAYLILRDRPLPPHPFLAADAGYSPGDIACLKRNGKIEKAGRAPPDWRRWSRPPWLWRAATGQELRAGHIGQYLGSTARDRSRDREEVATYMSSHPEATVFDVALCCHMADGHARRIMKQLAESYINKGNK